MQDTQQSITSTVKALNHAWTNDDWEALCDICHPDMAIEDLKGGKRLDGRDACVDSYRQFVESAELHSFHQGDVNVSAIGTTAIAHYTFAIDYSMKGTRYQELGRDLFVFTQKDGKWLAIWRTLLPEDEQQVDL
ncbi:DUF4440 domain-containing protein [bacterium]|nr:DUF4440 domain-containing protein [bacterium]